MAASTRIAHSEILAEHNITLPSFNKVFMASGRAYVHAADATRLSSSYEQAMAKILGVCANLKTQLEEERKSKQETDTRFQLLVSNFERLVNDSASGDLLFDVKGTIIYAHSSVVSLWSVPFELMLRSTMREGVSKRIEITTEEPAAVKEMVKYFYTAEADINPETALPLLRLSSLYQIESLRDQCCVFLSDNVDEENCVQLFYLANLHRFERAPKWRELYNTCLDYIRTRHNFVLQASPSPFKGLDLPLVVMILREILEVPAVNPRHPYVMPTHKLLSSAVVNWAKDNWPVRDMPELITFINSEVARNKIQVFVKTSKNTLVILASETKKVHELKRVIEGKEAIPIAFQLLMFNGKVLRDDLSLRDCGILNDSTIQLCIRSNLTTGSSSVVHEATQIDEGSDQWKALYDFCLTSVVADFEEQCKCVGFLKLDTGTITHILQQDELAVSHEHVVLDALVSWLEARPDVRNNMHVMSRLLPLVRFPYIDTQRLLNVPLTHPTIAACDIFKSLLQEALHFQISRTPVTQQPREVSYTRRSPQKRQQPSSDDLQDNTLRTKRRLLYNEVPTVNLDQFFSYVVSTVVGAPQQQQNT